MHAKSWRVAGLILAAIVVGALAVAPAYAAAPTQQAGVNNWITLNPGQTVEWRFNYLGNDDPAVVELGMSASNSVGFNVFTDDQWMNGDVATPLGKGTQHTQKDTSTGDTVILDNGNLFWETGASAPNLYHIQVYSRSDQPVQYWINASGAGAGTLMPFGAAGTATAANTNLQAQSTQSTAPSAQAQVSATNAQSLPAPSTLPTTGSTDINWLLAAAALTFIAVGWMARRRTSRS